MALQSISIIKDFFEVFYFYQVQAEKIYVNKTRKWYNSACNIMTKKKLRAARKNKRITLFGGGVIIVIAVAVIAIILKHDTQSLTAYTPAQQIVRVVNGNVSAISVPYSIANASNLYVRLGQESGTYMRPYIPH